MGVLWWIAPAAVAVFGVLFVGAGATHLVRGEVGRGGRNVLGGAAVGAIGLALSLVGINMQLFSRLTYEAPVAMVSVKDVNPADSTYLVTVKRLDGNIPVQSCTIQGDEWLIGGRVQKWKPWANVLGLDTTYTLDQISNKYSTAERGNGKMITSCDLTGKPVVNQYVPDDWLPWILDHFYTEDRRFGSANYMPLADGASYKVVITQAGFNAEPANDAAKAANDAAH
ncbi:MAG: hypothetical protein JSR60_17640 [Proteobacteria bacterium]|nr:hypothetical protein [Pseudomonadota bacterium]